MAERLEKAHWNDSTLQLGEVEFEARVGGWDERQPPGRLMRPRDLIERYTRFWSSRPAPRNMLELGIWEGGSAVFWFEAFEPEKYVGIDFGNRGDTEHFKSYVESRGVS